MVVKKNRSSETDEVIEEVQIPEPVTDEKNIGSKSEKTADNVGSFCVYIGPSVRGVIQSGMVFSGTKEEAVASLPDAVHVYPLIATLIVPGGTLAEDRIKVKTAGNLLNVNYNKLVASLKSK
ncbi:MAG: hypothetical protein K0R50_396 [Eubacterium sp.]|jgi:hypothetical protein|nr:hypothetical protein [Eubacterium sp.]